MGEVRERERERERERDVKSNNIEKGCLFVLFESQAQKKETNNDLLR